jgi:hypothetical protein
VCSDGGTYCPAGSAASVECPSGSYCPPSSASPTVCPAGNYCGIAFDAYRVCPAGDVCPEGSTEPISCTATGFFCPEGSAAAVPCNAGYYCPAGTSVEIPCPPGAYCTLASPELCPPGSYCVGGASQPQPCDPGTREREHAQVRAAVLRGVRHRCQVSCAAAAARLKLPAPAARTAPRLACRRGLRAPLDFTAARQPRSRAPSRTTVPRERLTRRCCATRVTSAPREHPRKPCALRVACATGAAQRNRAMRDTFVWRARRCLALRHTFAPLEPLSRCHVPEASCARRGAQRPHFAHLATRATAAPQQRSVWPGLGAPRVHRRPLRAKQGLLAMERARSHAQQGFSAPLAPPLRTRFRVPKAPIVKGATPLQRRVTAAHFVLRAPSKRPHGMLQLSCLLRGDCVSE